MNYGVIQNSMKGIFILQQNFNKGNLTLQIAVASNPKKASEIRKGDKIYDYDNSRWFSLSEEECHKILNWLASSNKENLEIKHYPSDKMTVLTLSKIFNDEGKLTGYGLRFSEIQNKQVVFSVSVGANIETMQMFANFLKSISMVKTLAAYYEFTSWKSRSNNNRSNSGNYNKSSNGQQTFSNSTPKQQNDNTNPPDFLQDNNPLAFLSS